MFDGRRLRLLLATLLVIGLLPLGTQTAVAHGLVDQDMSVGTGGVVSSAALTAVWGQTFIPTRSPLVAVDTFWCAGPEPGIVTVAIRPRNAIFGPNLAATSVALPGYGNEQLTHLPITHIDFDEPITLVPGDQYAVMVVAGGNGICGRKADLSQPYLGGTAFFFVDEGSGPEFRACCDDLFVRTYSLAQQPQTIAFGPLPDRVFGDAAFSLSASASSALAITFSADGQCSVSADMVIITGAGSCTITAFQPGDANWFPAPDVSQSFAIGKADQTINFEALPGRTYGDPPFTAEATASSGLSVSFSAAGQCAIGGSTITLISAGSCTITASQAGNVNYNAAPDVSQSFPIAMPVPTNKDQCKNGGWMTFASGDGTAFSNQGDCIQYVNTGM